jgi:hypothetical protein
MGGIAEAILQVHALIWVVVYMCIAAVAGLWLLLLVSLMGTAGSR